MQIYVVKDKDNDDNNNLITICHVSDIMNLSELIIPQCDIFILSGNSAEYTKGNCDQKLQELSKFFSTIPSRNKFFVFGKNEQFLQTIPNSKLKKLEKYVNIISKKEKFIEIRGVRIYLMPYFSPEEFSQEEIREKMLAIPNTASILVSPTPPKGTLDPFHIGNSALADIFHQNIKPNLKLVLFGQVENQGIDENDGVVFSNAYSTINYFAFPLPLPTNPHQGILNEMEMRAIPGIWKWKYKNKVLMNVKANKVLDVDKYSDNKSVILYEPRVPTPDNQKWTYDPQQLRFVSSDNLNLEVRKNGYPSFGERFNDSETPETFQYYWNIQSVSLFATPHSSSPSQKWFYHPASGLLQNLEDGSFLGMAQFGRFYLIQPALPPMNL